MFNLDPLGILGPVKRDMERIVSGFRIRLVDGWQVFDPITRRKVGTFPTPLEAERYIRSTIERGIREMAKILPPGFRKE